MLRMLGCNSQSLLSPHIQGDAVQLVHDVQIFYKGRKNPDTSLIRATVSDIIPYNVPLMLNYKP